ncbi:MAG: GNAT family N-acetyltransferase [Anaerolineae bacterium]
MPPPYSGMGYATSCVAHLSILLLERGFRYCCLFANAANATSNYVYGKIGYRLVCRMSEVRFQQTVQLPCPEGEHG